MAINYGNIDHSKPPKKGKKSPKQDEIREDQMTAEALEKHLAALAYKSSSSHVGKAATAELLERKAPRSKNPEERLTADDVRRVCDIYERHERRLFGKCPHCGKELANDRERSPHV